jgi:hypothetical protein
MTQPIKTGLLFAHLENDEDSYLGLIAVQRLTIIFSIDASDASISLGTCAYNYVHNLSCRNCYPVITWILCLQLERKNTPNGKSGLVGC